jgi:hypothetical protein
LENVDIFYGHLEYFINTWDILWPFGIFCVHFAHFFQCWCHAPRKIWQLCSRLFSLHKNGLSLLRRSYPCVNYDAAPIFMMVIVISPFFIMGIFFIFYISPQSIFNYKLWVFL